MSLYQVFFITAFPPKDLIYFGAEVRVSGYSVFFFRATLTVNMYRDIRLFKVVMKENVLLCYEFCIDWLPVEGLKFPLSP